jgi:hypothetical protein
MTRKRSLIITSILGIAVILGFVALRGIKVPPEGTEGTIGAANRYQTDQISAKDVQLQDAEIQAFLQSDTFHRLATNPQFRNVIKEQSFREVAGTQAYQTLMENKDQAQSLANKQFVQYLVQPSTVAMVTSEAFVKVASESNLSELLQTPGFFELVASTLENKPTAAEFRETLLQSKGLSPTFVEYAGKNADVVLAAFQPALIQARDMLVSLNGAAELLANPGIATLLESRAFADVVTLDAHEELMKTPEIMGLAFNSDVFNRMVQAERWPAIEQGFKALDQQ